MSLVELEKRSSYKSIAKNTVGVIAGLEALNMAKGAIEKRLDRTKVRNSIAYARQKHPELRRRSDADLGKWIQGVYAIAPRIATSPALAASALLTIDSYNGNFDLSTAKILSDINKGSGSDGNDFMSAMNTAIKLG